MGHLAAPKPGMSWQAICDAKKEGVIKSIGIKTYGMMNHLQELLRYELPFPAAHQVCLN